ncbi:hypothetical protein VUR80DRAFT_812 [Thermomyces stellatus]
MARRQESFRQDLLLRATRNPMLQFLYLDLQSLLRPAIIDQRQELNEAPTLAMRLPDLSFNLLLDVQNRRNSIKVPSQSLLLSFRANRRQSAVTKPARTRNSHSSAIGVQPSINPLFHFVELLCMPVRHSSSAPVPAPLKLDSTLAPVYRLRCLVSPQSPSSAARWRGCPLGPPTPEFLQHFWRSSFAAL